MKTIWKKRKEIQENKIESLSTSANLSPVISEILLERDFDSPSKVNDYFTEGLKNLDELSFIHSIQTSVDRILDALENEEKITIYGDFDCDGTIGSAIIYDYLKNNDGNVSYYIPDRLKEGYGLNKEAIKKLKDQGTNLIITVDNGISSNNEVDYIKELGMDIIITDHHNYHEKLPDSSNIIDFKCEQNNYFKEICGAGVSFLLILALNEILCLPNFKKREYAELVTIATIADIVELRNFNRDLVKVMLNQMNSKGIRNKALNSLYKKAQLDKLSVGNIGFRIAPMINAAGRIGNADKIIELFTTNDCDQIENITEYLFELNSDRCQIENEILDEARKKIIDEQIDEEVLIISNKHWHQGVIGIVASKIQEEFYKPVIIISFDENDIGHGSCRSVPGFNIFEALDISKEYLIKYGGHNQAAGLTINKKDLKDFKESILKYAKDQGLKKETIKEINYDLEIDISKIDKSLLTDLEKLEPFGVSNPEPVFKITNPVVSNPRLIGKNNNHLTFNCNQLNCVFFNEQDIDFPKQQGYSFLAKIRRNCYNENIQLILLDQKIDPFKNFKYIDDLVKNSLSAEEIQNELSMFGKRNLINRNFLVKLYKLAKKVNSRGFYVKDFIKKSNTTLVDLVIALNILKEANLIQYDYKDGVLKFQIIPQTQKVELKNTKTFKLFKNS